MISFEDARRYVLDACAPLDPVRVSLADARGLVLREEVTAAADVPAFANTAMDGFAVRAADTAGASDATPVVLRIAGTVRAGAVAAAPLEPGSALRIMTGAPVPDGADAVVMVERTRAEADGGFVEILDEVAAGNHLRAAGTDVPAGAVVFGAGTLLHAAHLGVLASVGVEAVVVGPRLRVGVLSTGDELVPAGRPLGPGQIHDSNRLALLALLAESGFDGVDLGLIADDETAIGDAIRAAVASAPSGGAPACDALITSGGVSMGDFDFVKVVLDRIGDMRWMQVAIKPAKPLAFGTVADAVGAAPRRVPVFGLPGNPVSSMVSYELFARPALRRMAGFPESELDRPRLRARARESFGRRADGKVHFVRVVGSWSDDRTRLEVRSAGGQGSHQLTGMAAATGLAVLPDGPGVPEGGEVEVIVLRGPTS